MVMDFGFLKDLLLENIDAPCDHGTIVWVLDRLMLTCLGVSADDQRVLDIKVGQFGSWETREAIGKLYVVPFIPTAENLARHWFERLGPRVSVRSDGTATLVRVRVWETPSSFCDYTRS